MPQIGDREIFISWINGSKAVALAKKRGMKPDESYWDYVNETEIEESRRFPTLGLAKGWGKRYGVGLDDFKNPWIEVQVYGHEDQRYPAWDLVERWEWQENEWIKVQG